MKSSSQNINQHNIKKKIEKKKLDSQTKKKEKK